MASKITICSQALLRLSASSISSFDENNTEAKLCSTLYDDARDAVLRSHPWNCAVKRVALAPDATAPVYGDFTYAFTIPSDMLRLLEVESALDHRLEDGKILASDNPLYIKYVFRNENVATYDPLLISALSAYMQAELAYPITKSTTQQKAAWDLYTGKLRLARSVDAQEDPPVTIGDSPLIQVRHSGI